MAGLSWHPQVHWLDQPARPPPSASLGKSMDGAVAGTAYTPLGCMGTRVRRSAGAAPPASPRSSHVDSPKVSKDPFLLIPGQSEDYPVEVESSREPCPASSAASTWVNLDSDSSQQEGSSEVRSSAKPTDMQAKIKQLEKTFAALQAQLISQPQSSTPKVTAFNAVVELVNDNFPTEVLVETHSPQKRGWGRPQGCLNLSLNPSSTCPGIRMR